LETVPHVMIKLASGQVNVLIASGSTGFPNGFHVIFAACLRVLGLVAEFGEQTPGKPARS